MLKKLCLFLLIIIVSLWLPACVTIQDAQICSVAGMLSAGAICGHTLSPETSELTFEQYVAFLEASPDHAAAVCMSASDYTRMKTELESACRQMGSKCNYKIPKPNKP